MNLTEFFGRQNRATLFATGSVLLVTVVFLDLASGPAFESSVFYLLPVSFFAWFLGRRIGLIVSLVCAAIGLAIHRSQFPDARSEIVYWNALAWLAVWIFFILIISELQTLYKRERARSHTDMLTGIPNRRAFLNGLELEKNRARRYGRPLTLAYVDLDFFKTVNDTLGHQTGDKLLGVVANTLKSNVRQADVVARLGGDEFALLFPETDRFSAEAVLGKLRDSLDAAMKQQNWPITFSIGVVTFQPPPESVPEMISAADQAMYTAKKSGPGRLVIWSTA